jgi:flagellar motor protein MotB
VIRPEHDARLGDGSPVWPVFGDLMACLFGLFVLFFIWAITFQVTLAEDLATEKAARAKESVRLEELEHALAGPLAAGTITIVDGRIGIRGSVLFDSNSAELAPEGARLLQSLVKPLAAYVADHDQLIMVSGFTDDHPIKNSPQGYRDNWELSSQRALTVTRTLLAEGIPADAIVAAGFGDTHPIASNDTPDDRAKNRRVEIAPIPRQKARRR